MNVQENLQVQEGMSLELEVVNWKLVGTRARGRGQRNLNIRPRGWGVNYRNGFWKGRKMGGCRTCHESKMGTYFYDVEQRCPIELSVMMEILYIYIVQYGSH